MINSFLEAHRPELNAPQLEAVEQVKGPVLVLAGAGSGKTRVLTYRIAHLVYDLRVPLPCILAMTFSNKAAREMHDRVKALLNDDSSVRFPWISTFHSVCARLLRQNGSRLGYKSDFVIYDDSEQKGMIKTCLEKLKFSDKQIDPSVALNRIGDWKNLGRMADEVEDLCASTLDENCSQIYREYTREMLNAQAMDFDDLLLNTYRLFKNHSDLRSRYQEQWKYVLIDEFQDTNDIQYKLLKEILNSEKNICVVGDDDQSIYGWRGAKIENILNFDQEFKNARVIKLEQNYRSTEFILKAADSVISKNELRHSKTLWTAQKGGQKIRLAVLQDDRSEAHFVVSEIKRLMQSDKIPASEFAVFYRVNSLSRGFEEECLRQRIPYRIVGGFRFYERKEIKDLLSYFRILLNPSDVMAFRRTINMPLRGIGKTSLEKLEQMAFDSGKPIGSWLVELEGCPVSGKAREGLSQYREILLWGFGAVHSGNDSLVDLFIDGIRKTGYMEMLEAQRTEESQERLDNIQELLSAVQEFEEVWRPSEEADPSDGILRQKLREFLERVSLIADVDGMDTEDPHQVTFMSLHSAKGLEFKTCFMTGMEEGLFPSARSFDSYQRTEEERRLCYVGITRAREKLYITRANRRRTFGSINFNMASRFLKDLPKEVFETVIEENDFNDSNDFYQPAQYGRKKSSAAAWEDIGFDFDQRIDVDESGFHKGDRVVHPSFGEGIVQRTELLGDDECLSIVFAGRGLKKVLAKFVKKKE